ncbi:L-threonine O-3-phosphate decarboxylase [Rhizobium sp. PP-F2F-G48]|uniref:threonine-phosphate decarboxylase CobD n=1 Tax=Rhizobium sp. PP-F2F-G48 TaxID=2135651 RepID=UPI0010534B1A|nr:threonine-phosphate decarboxylase CobD [Rhizobium sp. PP-F2F-G48]TCM58757.1 L-threonine O-3-phosphate decarboxylase [Rhizobium sp. PP-F2F-G48]
MTAPIQHGGGLSRAMARYGGVAADWLDLSTGINPCPPPLPEISAAVWHRLPDADLVQRAEAAAGRFYGTGHHRPLAVPGTQSVIQQLPAFAGPGRPVAILGPTYGEYRRVLSLSGLGVDPVSDPHDIRPDHGLAVVVNPNNPTGRLLPRQTLLDLADRMAAQGGRLVVDEAFGDEVFANSVAAEAFVHPGLVVFRSFGKLFGHAGIRLGFVMAVPEVLETLATALGPWAVSGPALAVAEALFQGDLDGLRSRIAERKAGLESALSGAGLRTIGGTHLFSLLAVRDGAALQHALCEQHILTRSFDYAPQWLRLGLTPDPASDRRLLSALLKAAA